MLQVEAGLLVAPNAFVRGASTGWIPEKERAQTTSKATPGILECLCLRPLLQVEGIRRWTEKFAQEWSVWCTKGYLYSETREYKTDPDLLPSISN